MAPLTNENPDISAELLELLWLGLTNHDPERLDSLANKLSDIFDAWKQEFGTKTPRTQRGVKGLRQYRKIAFEDAAPYECADPASGVSDYASLCLHLMQTNYLPMEELLESEDFYDVISVSARIERESIRTSSLLWITKIAFQNLLRNRQRYSDLKQLVIDSAPSRHVGEKTTKNLVAGRPAGAEAKKLSAEKQRKFWQKAAVDYLVSRPNKTLDDTAKFIFSNTYANLNPDKRALRTIRDAISGCDKEARQKLSKPGSS